VIVALPDAIAVTRPLFTAAMALLLLSQVTFWFVAFEGWMVCVSCSVPPAVNVIVFLLSDTPVTGTVVVAGLTVTEHVAV
jgi:hypothetical protein